MKLVFIRMRGRAPYFTHIFSVISCMSVGVGARAYVREYEYKIGSDEYVSDPRMQPTMGLYALMGASYVRECQSMHSCTRVRVSLIDILWDTRMVAYRV